MPYAMELFHILDEEYSHLYGTVPLTEAQMEGYVDQYFGFVLVDMVPIVVNEDGRWLPLGLSCHHFQKRFKNQKVNLLPLGLFIS